MTCNLSSIKNPQIFVHPVFMMQKSSSHYFRVRFCQFETQRENDSNVGPIRKYRSSYSTHVKVKFTGIITQATRKIGNSSRLSKTIQIESALEDCEKLRLTNSYCASTVAKSFSNHFSITNGTCIVSSFSTEKIRYQKGRNKLVTVKVDRDTLIIVLCCANFTLRSSANCAKRPPTSKVHKIKSATVHGTWGNM